MQGPQLSVDSPRPRLLWNAPVGIALGFLALLLTAGIVAMQLYMRAHVFEPQGLPIFYRLFLFQDYTAAFLLVGVLLLIAPLPAAQRAAASLALAMGRAPLTVSGICLLVLAAGALWVYEGYPLAMDEFAPYMQSRIFAEGELVGQFPPALLDWLIPEPFRNYFVHFSRETGEIASSYWPGFALLLTPFMAAGVPWLCNPVLGAAAVWVIHRLTLELTQRTEAAGAASLFAAASAAFTVNAISFYSMTAHLLCNAVFVLLLLRPTFTRSLCAGLVGGLALTLHNPIPHMLFAAPWLLWLLFRSDRWRTLPTITAGYLPGLIIFGFGWRALISGLAGGDAVPSAFTMLSGVFNWPTPVNLWDRLIALAKIWLWAAPLLLLLAGLGFWRERGNTAFRLMVASATATFIGYLFVPLDQGHGWGFRYFHSAWFVLPVFAGAALGSAPAMQLHRRFEEASRALSSWTLAAALGGLLVLTPYFAWQVHQFIHAHRAQLPTASSGTTRIVILTRVAGYYPEDLVQNDPFLREPVITMFTQGREADEAMVRKYFPDLVMLNRTYRGSVWGYAPAESTGSADPTVGRDQHGEQK